MPAKKPASNGAAKSNGAKKPSRTRQPKKLVEIDLTDEADLAPAPRRRAPVLKVGDHVAFAEGKGAVGIVEELDNGKVRVYWGSTDKRRVESWVAKPELVKIKGKVTPPDEVIKRQAMK